MAVEFWRGGQTRPQAALTTCRSRMPPGGEPAARDFYGRLLGLAEVTRPPELAARGGVWLVGSGIHLHLGVENDFRPARKAHVALVAADLEQLRNA